MSILEGITALKGLSEWSDENDEPVTDNTINDTNWLIGECARECYVTGATWQKPKVVSTPSGAIHIFWRRGEATLSMNVLAKAQAITCVLTPGHAKTVTNVLPLKVVARYVALFCKGDLG